jgi:hypothetical protein
MFRFTIRDVLWLIVLVTCGCSISDEAARKKQLLIQQVRDAAEIKISALFEDGTACEFKLKADDKGASNCMPSTRGPSPPNP